MSQIVAKKIKLRLVGLDGNAFSLMAAFSARARKEGWTRKEVQSVTSECMKGDYNHLIRTLAAHCEKDGS